MQATICRIASWEPYVQTPPIGTVTLIDSSIVIEAASEEDHEPLEKCYRSDYQAFGPVTGEAEGPDGKMYPILGTGLITYKAGTPEHFRAVTLDIHRIGLDWVKGQTDLT